MGRAVKIVTLDGVSDENRAPGVYVCLSIGNGEKAWFAVEEPVDA